MMKPPKRNRRAAGLLCCLLAWPAMAAEVTFHDDGPLAGKGYPFSESVRVGDLLFLAGQIGDRGGQLVDGGIEAEARQTLRNIESTLQRRGLGLPNVVKCTVFLADIGEWARFNEVYKEFFKPPYPARSALGVNGLAMDARTEVECIAAY
jgi:reactive intermediate/imine deaminase